MARSNNENYSEICFKRGSCRIILKHDDLFNENNVDVRVIPTPEFGTQESHTYPLFEALWSISDENLQNEIHRLHKKIKPLGKPQIISHCTPAIMLTPIPYCGNKKSALKMLQNTYLTCLQHAVDQKYQTIAFPTIGCGNSGFQPRDAAKYTYNALEQCESLQENKLNEIQIIIYDTNVYNEFIDTFMELSGGKHAKIKLHQVLSKDSNSSEMSSNKNKNQASQQHSRDDETKDYPDDFDDTDKSEQHRFKSQRSHLDPESPEFRPQSKSNQHRPRPRRRYHINQNRTELIILQGDILQTKVDAIVNAANEMMLGGGGVDGVIHEAAGNELFKACKAHKKIFSDVRLPTGRSRILLSYNLSKTTYYIINTAGPRYNDNHPEKCTNQLISCYETSLALANLYDLETIGFTAISCGIFGYPLDEGAEVALRTVDKEAGSMRQIYFILKDDAIYDAWVKKAEELQFNSMDNFDVTPKGISTQSNSNTSKTTKETSPNVETETSNKLAKLNVIDGLTSDNRENTSKSNRIKSSEKPSSNPTEESNNKKTAENNEASNISNDNQGTQEKASSNKKNNSQNKEIKSDNSSKQKQHEDNKQKPQSPIGTKNTNTSIVKDSVGRGRKK